MDIAKNEDEMKNFNLDGIRSKCCVAPIKVEGGEEGTFFYVCTKCLRVCDPMTQQEKEAFLNNIRGIVDPILDKMAIVVIIHKHSLLNASFMAKVKDVRRLAEIAIKKFSEQAIDPAEFIIVEFIVEENSTRVTKL